MKKSDLKDRMLVELRDNGDQTIYMVIDGYLVGSDSWDTLDVYSENLLHVDLKGLDIIKVSKKIKGWRIIPKNWTKETLIDNLLWERKDEEKANKKFTNKKHRQLLKALDKLDTFIGAVNEHISNGDSSIKIDGNGTSDEVSNQIKQLLTKLQDII